MTVQNQNAKIYRGDTAQLAIGLTQADGTPFAPSLNADFKWRMSPNWHTPEADALVRKQLGEGIEIITGGITIDLTSADTDLLPGIYHHELKVWDNGDVATAMVGVIVIRKAMRSGEASSPAAAVITLSGEVPTVT